MVPSNSMKFEGGCKTALFGTMVCGDSKDADKFGLDIPRSELSSTQFYLFPQVSLLWSLQNISVLGGV